jgi:beta-glucosidase
MILHSKFIRAAAAGAALVCGAATLQAEATVINTGKMAGDEVAELYLSFPNVAGASEKVQFVLQSRDLSMVTVAGDIIVPEGEFQLSIGGGQPGTGARNVTGTFRGDR